MVTPVPVIGTQGFATDSVTKFSTLMAHLFESDYKQTQLYPGKVTSISRIMELSGSDMGAVSRNLKEQLQSYFSAYYDSATVDVAIPSSDAANAQVTVRLDIRVYDAGQETTMTWQFTSQDNIIVKVLNLSNFGG